MSKEIPSRSTKKSVNAKNSANGAGADSGMASDGEGFGVGSSYTAVLNERQNKSINRNNGADRPSANTGMVPTVSKESRKTGRV